MRISLQEPRHPFSWFYVSLVTVLALAVIAGALYAVHDEGLRFSPARTMNEGWSYVQNDVPQPLGALPASFDAAAPTLTLRHPINVDMIDAQKTLAFKTYFAGIKVLADDTLIYASPDAQEKIPSACWHFIPMEKCIGAQALTVQLNNYENTSTFFFEQPLLDTAGSIQISLLQKNIGATLFAVIGLLLTLLLVIFVVMLRKWRSPVSQQMLALATFVFLSVLWELLDAQVFAIYGGNIAIQYYLGCAAFFLLPAPYLLYVRITTKECYRSTNILIVLTLVNAILALLLRIFDIVTLSMSLYVVHAIILATIVLAIVAFWRAVVDRGETQLRNTFIGMIIVAAFIAVSLVLFYTRNLITTNTSSLYTIGLAVLLLFMAADALRAFGQERRQREATERYRRLAMEDSMTGLSNRNAFHLHWSALQEHPPEQLAIVVFDINNLKQINDRLGHQAGDRAIAAAARLIRASFDRVGHCYRTGGDEFEVFVEGRDIARIPALLERFSADLAQTWDSALPSDGVSYGWASTRFDPDHPLTEVALISLRAEADNSLYQQKVARKHHDEAINTQ